MLKSRLSTWGCFNARLLGLTAHLEKCLTLSLQLLLGFLAIQGSCALQGSWPPAPSLCSVSGTVYMALGRPVSILMMPYACRQEKMNFCDNVYCFDMKSIKERALIEPLVDYADPDHIAPSSYFCSVSAHKICETMCRLLTL